jgi:hypothetical protein
VRCTVWPSIASIIFQYVCPCSETRLYVHQVIFNKFSAGHTPDPRFKGEGAREGKRRVGLEGMKWEGKMKEEEEGTGGEGG